MAIRLVQPVATLVARARRGDQAAAAQLYEDHADMVHGYCLAFCRGDREQARELGQEAFVTALTALDELREPERFSGWMKMITRRTCLRWIERKKTEQLALDRVAHEPHLGPGDPEAAARAVRAIIEACPDPILRETARLFYTPPPRSTGEIALELDTSRTAITTRLLRFRTWARQRMLAELLDAMEDLS